MGESRAIFTEADVDELCADMKARLNKGWRVEFSRLSRTGLQNNSLHRGCDELAKRLNDAGFDQRKLLSMLDSGFDIPWTTHSIKETFYKPILSAMTGKKSTREMDTVEPGEVFEKMGKRISELTGVTAPAWPDRFNRGGRE
jgi:hypothetical protein